MRTQIDGLGDEMSESCGASFDAGEDRTRQEFKDDADANLLLKRFGAGVPQRSVEVGEVDFSVDLLQALEAARAASAAFGRLDPAIRATYPDWGAVLKAQERGELVFDRTGVRFCEKPVAGAASLEGAVATGSTVR